VIDCDIVRHVARLARLHLSEEEEETMRRELSGILEHIEEITSLDLDDVPVTTHVVQLENVLGEDVPHEELSAEDALREAPEVAGGGFSVPRMG
jgi:aspartyl-tRNA(Asn)/glutamyl-tRNA(Gln) amidotransferase subunit C